MCTILGEESMAKCWRAFWCLATTLWYERNDILYSAVWCFTRDGLSVTVYMGTRTGIPHWTSKIAFYRRIDEDCCSKRLINMQHATVSTVLCFLKFLLNYHRFLHPIDLMKKNFACALNNELCIIFISFEFRWQPFKLRWSDSFVIVRGQSDFCKFWFWKLFCTVHMFERQCFSSICLGA